MFEVFGRTGPQIWRGGGQFWALKIPYKLWLVYRGSGGDGVGTEREETGRKEGEREGREVGTGPAL